MAHPRPRLGIFGGTFDPPHLGHLIVASDAYERLGLERLIFVPAAVPPHKGDAVSAAGEQRLRMVRAAVAGDARFAVDDVEIRRGGTSYSVETLRALRAREPDAELVFLIGTDQYRVLETWREPDEIVRLARLAVLSRSGDAPVAEGRYPAEFLPVPRIDISATAIRARVRDGQSIRYLVPEAVREMVEEEGLYR